jgi:hypothetical protein
MTRFRIWKGRKENKGFEPWHAKPTTIHKKTSQCVIDSLALFSYNAPVPDGVNGRR